MSRDSQARPDSRPAAQWAASLSTLVLMLAATTWAATAFSNSMASDPELGVVLGVFMMLGLTALYVGVQAVLVRGLERAGHVAAELGSASQARIAQPQSPLGEYHQFPRPMPLAVAVHERKPRLPSFESAGVLNWQRAALELAFEDAAVDLFTFHSRVLEYERLGVVDVFADQKSGASCAPSAMGKRTRRAVFISVAYHHSGTAKDEALKCRPRMERRVVDLTPGVSRRKPTRASWDRERPNMPTFVPWLAESEDEAIH